MKEDPNIEYVTVKNKGRHGGIVVTFSIIFIQIFSRLPVSSLINPRNESMVRAIQQLTGISSLEFIVRDIPLAIMYCFLGAIAYSMVGLLKIPRRQVILMTFAIVLICIGLDGRNRLFGQDYGGIALDIVSATIGVLLVDRFAAGERRDSSPTKRI